MKICFSVFSYFRKRGLENWASISYFSLNVVNITRFREYGTTAICESVKNLTLAVITISYHKWFYFFHKYLGRSIKLFLFFDSFYNF